MESAKSYIKDTSDFLRKLNELGKLPENAILVTTDVVGLYPSIPHADGIPHCVKFQCGIPQYSTFHMQMQVHYQLSLKNERIRVLLERIFCKWLDLL